MGNKGLTMNKNEKLQKLFLGQLSKKAGSDKQLIDILKTEIGLSKSAAYRRLNGEAFLSFWEIVELSKKFNVSLDQFTNNQANIFLARFPFMNHPVKNFKDYLQPIHNNLSEALTLSDTRLSFISREIPLFHYFSFPELTAFKAYLWGRMMWDFPRFQKKQFSLNDVKGISQIRKSIVSLYYKTPGIEIWGNNNLDITFNQIHYHLDNGMFKYPEEALILCEQLNQLMEHLYSMTFHGKKFEFGQSPTNNSVDFSLFQSQLAPTSNFIILDANEISEVYVNIDNLHTLKTDNDSFIQFMSNWKKTLQKHSEEITIKSEKSRVRFFNDAEKRLKKFEAQIKKKISELE